MVRYVIRYIYIYIYIYIVKPVQALGQLGIIFLKEQKKLYTTTVEKPDKELPGIVGARGDTV